MEQINLRKSVGIFLLNNKKEMLFQLRDNFPNIDYPNYWSIIGGEIGERESSRQAIIRESKEELGTHCKIEEIRYIDEIKLKKDSNTLKDTSLYIFKGNIKSPLENIKLTEGQRVDFFGIDDLINLKIPGCIEEFIIKNKQRILN